VLAVDPERRKIFLTRKKLLLASSLSCITNYEQATVDTMTHACVAAVKSFGVIVKFYNNIKALAPLNQLK
jgi:rRNA biogenesis protein RRP5